MSDSLNIQTSLRAANVARQAEWDPSDKITLTYRLNELAGETGEACNVGKKIERERLGIRGSRDTIEHLAEELGDVVICADLVAMAEGIDLDAAVAAKFNATSEKVGLKTRLVAPAPEVRAAPFDRDDLIALIMEETTDDIVADGWDRLGKPNVLVQGCRYIRRNAPASPEGYANPEASAKQFAGFIADRVLKALATREEAPAEAGEAARIIARHLPLADAPDTVCLPITMTAGDLRTVYAALRAQPQAREDAQLATLRTEMRRAVSDWIREDAPVSLQLEMLPEITTKLVDRLSAKPLYTHPAPDALRGAVTDIAAERQRQVDVEGWSEAHDDEHDGYQMARAAGCYAFHASREDDDGDTGMFVSAAVHHGWPWDRAWWKPKSRRTDLVRAGALIVAEIERLDRAALQAEQKGGA
jgi:NTP pyrophosphatase (non-canonical NTP hydrolase)